MKVITRISSLLMLVCIGSFVMAQGNEARKFRLDGRLTGQNTKYVYLQYYNNSRKLIIDTARLTNGRFSFQGYINETTSAFVIGEKNSRHLLKKDTCC